MAPSVWLSYSWDLVDQVKNSRTQLKRFDCDNPRLDKCDLRVEDCRRSWTKHSFSCRGHEQGGGEPPTDSSIGECGGNGVKLQLHLLSRGPLFRRRWEAKGHKVSGICYFRQESRRSYFRLWKGESKEALRRANVLSVLRAVPPLNRLVTSMPVPGCREEQDLLESAGGGELSELQWILHAYSHLRMMQGLAIDWDSLPASIDPVRGGGFRMSLEDDDRCEHHSTIRCNGGEEGGHGKIEAAGTCIRPYASLCNNGEDRHVKIDEAGTWVRPNAVHNLDPKSNCCGFNSSSCESQGPYGVSCHDSSAGQLFSDNSKKGENDCLRGSSPAGEMSVLQSLCQSQGSVRQKVANLLPLTMDSKIDEAGRSSLCKFNTRESMTGGLTSIEHEALSTAGGLTSREHQAQVQLGTSGVNHPSDRMARGLRKQWQVQSLASLLHLLDLPIGSVVVDFGSGSGALVLPLAAVFPNLQFVAVDFKHQSIELLRQRAEAAGLSNISTFHGMIDAYPGKFDACVALHACGKATDDALKKAFGHRAAYIMSPCCVGKLNRRANPGGGCGVGGAADHREQDLQTALNADVGSDICLPDNNVLSALGGRRVSEAQQSLNIGDQAGATTTDQLQSPVCPAVGGEVTSLSYVASSDFPDVRDSGRKDGQCPCQSLLTYQSYGSCEKTTASLFSGLRAVRSAETETVSSQARTGDIAIPDMKRMVDVAVEIDGQLPRRDSSLPKTIKSRGKEDTGNTLLRRKGPPNGSTGNADDRSMLPRANGIATSTGGAKCDAPYHHANDGIVLPQSQWLQQAVSPAQFSLIVQVADWSSYDYSNPSAMLHRMCKALVELDRNEAAQERGYHTYLLHLLNPRAGAVGVGDIIVGVPGHDLLAAHMDTGFALP